MKFKYKLTGFDHNAVATFDIIFPEPTTVKDFICDVLENGSDRGYIGIKKEGTIYGDPRCEYDCGKLVTVLPPKYFFKKIISATAEGSTRRTNYLLTVEKDDGEG